jgi:hypothetical protein
MSGSDEDEFTKWSNEQDVKLKLELKRLIDDNEKVYGDSPFLASVRGQLQDYGHLTEKQVQRLKDGPPEKTYYDEDEYDYCGDPW